MKSYDFIILGKNHAAQIAAMLLAKNGKRVLIAEGGKPTPISWFSSSVLLEKMIDHIDGHSCFTAPIPFQLFTPSIRAEFNDETPIEEVLRRELPDNQQEILKELERLNQLGEVLSRFLYDFGLPLTGVFSKITTFINKFKSRIPLSELKKPFSARMENLEETSRDFLASLFSGLAGVPAKSLSTWEAALIWNGAIRTRAVSPSGLESIIKHRYDQLGIDITPLEGVKNIKITPSGIRCDTEIFGPCSGDGVIIGNIPEDLLPKETAKLLPKRSQAERGITSRLNGQISPLLAKRVIFKSEQIYRLSFGLKGEDLLCAIDPTNLHTPLSEEELTKELTPALPFANYRIEIKRPIINKESTDREDIFPAKFCNNLKPVKNVWRADAEQLFPSLGSIGEVMLGITLARNLSGKISK